VIPLDRVRRVLVRCPNWLGDTVMALPTVRALRGALPGAELSCLGPWVGPLLECEPGVDRRLDYPATWGGRWTLARALARDRLDLALVLPNSFGAALHARVAGARWRVGYARDGRSPLLTHAVPPPTALRHQVQEYLDLLAPLGVAGAGGIPSLRVSEARRREARRLLATVGWRPDRPMVGVQLGAAFGPSKLWPADRLAAVAARLERAGTAALFLGGPSGAPLLAAVTRAMDGPVRSLVGRDHPALLPAVLADLAVLVTPDSGPAHVAAAVGTPVVVLFGPTDPRRAAPAGAGHAALWAPPPCAPCYRPVCPIDHRCLAAIEVEAVASAVGARLGPAAAAGPATPRP
jgi:heptosyltransferase-2